MSRGRPEIPEDVEKKIVDTFKEHPEWSLRKIAEDVGNVSYGTVRTVLIKYKLWMAEYDREDS